MNIGSDKRITFSERGPKGPDQFDAGAQSFDSFRGLAVTTAVPYELSDEMDAVQMLQRTSQVGEYYVMAPPATYRKKGGKADLPDNYMDVRRAPARAPRAPRARPALTARPALRCRS